MSGSSAARPRDSKGSAVTIASFILMGVMCTLTMMKMTAKWLQISKLQSDDYFALAAMIFAVGETVAVFEQVRGGLGDHIWTLDQADIAYYAKAGYASEILYVPSMCLGKISVLLFTRIHTRRWISVRMNTILLVFCIVWGITTLFGVAFQCPIPHTWTVYPTRVGVCINRPAFWDSMGIINMVLELGLIGLPIYILWDLHMLWMGKVPIMVSFGARIFVIPLAILRLVYITETFSSKDTTYVNWKAVLLTQLEMHFCVMALSVPFLKFYFERVQHSIISSDLSSEKPRGHPLASKISSESDRSLMDKIMSPARRKHEEATESNAHRDMREEELEWIRHINGVPPGATLGQIEDATLVNSGESSILSKPSSTASDPMYIKKKTSLQVKYERNDEFGRPQRVSPPAGMVMRPPQVSMIKEAASEGE